MLVPPGVVVAKITKELLQKSSRLVQKREGLWANQVTSGGPRPAAPRDPRRGPSPGGPLETPVEGPDQAQQDDQQRCGGPRGPAPRALVEGDPVLQAGVDLLPLADVVDQHRDVQVPWRAEPQRGHRPGQGPTGGAALPDWAGLAAQSGNTCCWIRGSAVTQWDSWTPEKQHVLPDWAGNVPNAQSGNTAGGP